MAREFGVNLAKVKGTGLRSYPARRRSGLCERRG
ncbi:hypothetical protein LNP25_12865 [Klebsiella variicola subsp. variicola]|nr:hypothetical protein [Klebsiella variicola subsp. variicola]